MKIMMLKNYGGSLTGEKRILGGVYDSEDPALFGLADYLVENGHAVVVIPADGVWADDMTITTQSDTFSEGVPEDSLEEARAEYETETLAEKQADLARMFPDDPSLSLENFQEDDPDEILEKVEEKVPDAKPKRGRPKKK